MIQKIESHSSRVELGAFTDSSLFSLLESRYKHAKKIIIVDENTKNDCLPILLNASDLFARAEIVELPEGEENKAIEICLQVWEAFNDYKIQRKDLIINLGGGMITDIGGFIASVYKRGIDFINIPTSLLGMVDASIGGKTGVNFNQFKNQLGVFALPQLTVCDPQFLQTLPQRELISGKAEMLKHGLIANKELFYLLATDETVIPSQDLIFKTIQVKSEIVEKDLKETSNRKKLNFGHTIGHALEELFLNKQVEITHGECVALGMLAESYLSQKFAGLQNSEFQEIEKVIRRFYNILSLEKEELPRLIELMHHDKKNNTESINFTLLTEIGTAQIDFQIEDSAILQVLETVFGK